MTGSPAVFSLTPCQSGNIQPSCSWLIRPFPMRIVKGCVMFDHQKQEIEWGGRTLVLETGKVARQADGAVLGHLRRNDGSGDRRLRERNQDRGSISSRLRSTIRKNTMRPGRIPGGFFKREGRPTEKETLTSPADRPADPAAVRGRIQERHPDYHQRAFARYGE